MASLRVHPDRLEIHLTPAEKTLAFRRENVVIQRENIRSVTITDDPWIWVRGIRSPGALVPLVVAVGVWKFHGGKDFLAIKRRRQAVVIDLIGDDFARVILSTNHAPDLIASLKLEATDAENVPELDESVAPTTEPTEQAEPTVPVSKPKRTRTPKVVKPAEETAPATAVTTVKPARRARPAKVASVVETADSIEPGDAVEPTDAVEPINPATPVTPVKRASRAKATTAAKPVAKPVAKPATKPATKPAAKPTAKSTAKPAAKPLAEPADLPEATA